jgi:uncharacterized protein (DUF885 family)
MLNRRSVLRSGAAGAATLALAPMAQALDAKNTGGPALNALFDTFMAENLDQSPLFATSLGVDTGARAHQRSEIDDNSLAGIQKNKDLNASQLKRLEAFDRNSLSGEDLVSYDVVLYGLKTADEANRHFQYGNGGAGLPYAVSQMGGLYNNAPSFLDNQHPIETREDAEAYLSRLEGLARAFDEEAGVVRHDAGMGVILPDFALAKAIKQMQAMRAFAPETAPLTQSVVRRAKEKNLPGDWQARATKLVAEKVYPALDREIALMQGLQAKATHDAGVWKLPNGEQYYRDSVTFWTTSSMSPAEIHQTGLDIIKDHTARVDAIMRKEGMTQGTTGERLRAMYSDPKYRYPNTDEGKEKLIADLNVKVKAVRDRLPGYFGTLPKANVEIKRVPKEIELGQSGGYYNSPPLDGSRPGIYWINLRDTAEDPSWTLPTLTYHESIPGHHLQLSIQREAKMPLIRRVSYFSSYIEGWALYAEQLADEMGMYDDDVLGRIGQLHDAMLRAVRLVIDSGLHAMKMTREEGIKFFVDTIGDQEATAIGEVERYCVQPGQACGYMLGKLTFLREREKAKKALGAKFDIRKFHDAMLIGGAVPLATLDGITDRYIASV